MTFNGVNEIGREKVNPAKDNPRPIHSNLLSLRSVTHESLRK